MSVSSINNLIWTFYLSEEGLQSILKEDGANHGLKQAESPTKQKKKDKIKILSDRYRCRFLVDAPLRLKIPYATNNLPSLSVRTYTLGQDIRLIFSSFSDLNHWLSISVLFMCTLSQKPADMPQISMSSFDLKEEKKSWPVIFILLLISIWV